MIKTTTTTKTKYNAEKELYNQDGSLQDFKKYVAQLNASNEKKSLLKGQTPMDKKPSYHLKKVEGLKHTSKEELSTKTQETFVNMNNALKEGNLELYYNEGNEILTKKAIKLLNTVNIIIDRKEYADTLQEGKTLLWLELTQFMPYTRKDKIDDGVTTTTTETTYNSIKELLVDKGLEIGSRILFYVLTDRVQRGLRKYVFGDGNLNSQLELDAIASCVSTDTILEQIELKVDRIKNVELLQSTMNNTQYKFLQNLVNGKMVYGTTYNDLKDAIRNGVLSPEELRDVLPTLNTTKTDTTKKQHVKSYTTTQKWDMIRKDIQLRYGTVFQLYCDMRIDGTIKDGKISKDTIEELWATYSEIHTNIGNVALNTKLATMLRKLG